MTKYSVKLLSYAYNNLEEIYNYISSETESQEISVKIIESLEEAIYSLEKLPYRGTKRRTGVYANKGYRQIFMKNFTIVYRINELNKEVVIVTIRYSKCQF